MHFYPFNIGDYASATAHLEPLEDLAYRRLLDLYYSTEQPIPLDLVKVARLIRMRTHSECIAVVLDDFFNEEEDGYHCNRIDVELFKYHEKSEKASNSAKARWNKAKLNQAVKKNSERNASALNTQCEGNAKQETINKNKETLNNNINEPFNYFWLNMKLKKAAKPKAEVSFNKVASKQDDKMGFSKMLVADTKLRSDAGQFGFDRLNPVTYLNQERWEDDKPELAEDFDYVISDFNSAMARHETVPTATLMDHKRITNIKNLITKTNLTAESVGKYFKYASACESVKWQIDHGFDLTWFLSEEAYDKVKGS